MTASRRPSPALAWRAGRAPRVISSAGCDGDNVELRGGGPRSGIPAATWPHYFEIRAKTRQGLPEPPTILSGGVIRIAPLGGSKSRLVRLARPNLLLPCMMLWHGNGGSNRNA